MARRLEETRQTLRDFFPKQEESLLEVVRAAAALLPEIGDAVIASAEDAAFFRSRYRKKTPIVARPTPILLEPPPTPAPPPQESPPARPILKPAASPPPPVSAAPESPPPSIPRVSEKQIPPPALPKETSLLPSKALKTLIQRLAPHLLLFDEVPSDAVAKKISTRWKTKNQVARITLLSYGEIAEQRQFLEQIATALDVVFGPARLIAAEPIEKENQWDALLSATELEWIVCCDFALWQLQRLMTYYKETPAQQLRTLKDKPVFLLPDLSLYLKDPLLKRSLWRGLCQTLKPKTQP
jgi:hypothetical protein